MLNGTQSTIVGNLGRDPESQQVNGKTIARVSVGVTGRVKKQGQWQDTPVQWYRVTIWDQYQAEHALRSLHKGDRVIVAGSVVADEYDGRISLDMSADIIGVPLDRNDVSIIPRQQTGTRQQPQSRPAASASRQSDPWDASSNDFGGYGDDPEF